MAGVEDRGGSRVTASLLIPRSRKMLLPFAEGENYRSRHGRNCRITVLDGVDLGVPEKLLNGDVKDVNECMDM